MANTTWSTTDKTASVAISGSNLVATSSGGNQAGRSVSSQLTGKYYWEVTATTLANFGNTSVGIVNGTQALATFPSTSPWYPNGATLDRSGNLSSNGTLINGSAGGPAQGQIWCVALDMTNLRVWIRGHTTFNWNGNVTYDPAANIGGIDISAFTNHTTAPAFAVFTLAGSGDVVTANFGDSAFSGAVPSGFTSGLPAAPTSAWLTQIAAEHWLAAQAQARLTQVAVEQWALAGTGSGTQAQLTQIALEQWASAGTGTGTQARVMVQA